MYLTIGELTVLGLVAERPRHGYDIEQVIEQRGYRRWTDIGFSSIYYLLAKLEQRGLVATEGGRASAKARRVYQVTEPGLRAAAADVRELLAEADTSPRAFMAGLANTALLPDDAVDDALRTRLTRLDERIATVDAARRAQSPLPRQARDVFSYALSGLRADRAWLAGRIGAPDE